jgi:hypothetical protein
MKTAAQQRVTARLDTSDDSLMADVLACGGVYDGDPKHFERVQSGLRKRRYVLVYAHAGREHWSLRGFYTVRIQWRAS